MLCLHVIMVMNKQFEHVYVINTIMFLSHLICNVSFFLLLSLKASVKPAVFLFRNVQIENYLFPPEFV